LSVANANQRPTKLKQAKGARPMNQISRNARPDLRTTETVWSAPASPSRQYDKDGNPATVVVEFRNHVRASAATPDTAHAARSKMDIPRSSQADYDDGIPGTIAV
jgi:hypothetical protein